MNMDTGTSQHMGLGKIGGSIEMIQKGLYQNGGDIGNPTAFSKKNPIVK